MVHDEPRFVDELVAALSRAGHPIATFADLLGSILAGSGNGSMPFVAGDGKKISEAVPHATQLQGIV